MEMEAGVRSVRTSTMGRLAFEYVAGESGRVGEPILAGEDEDEGGFLPSPVARGCRRRPKRHRRHRLLVLVPREP